MHHHVNDLQDYLDEYSIGSTKFYENRYILIPGNEMVKYELHLMS